MPDSTSYTYVAYTIVFKGDPLDLQQYRHTALYFVPVAPLCGKRPVAEAQYCNAVGFRGEFEFESHSDRRPEIEENFAAQLKVGTLKRPLTDVELVDLMRAVPVHNDDYEFNCQTWVQLALERLYSKGFLTKQEYDDGVTDMVLETMKAGDEPAPFSVV